MKGPHAFSTPTAALLTIAVGGASSLASRRAAAPDPRHSSGDHPGAHRCPRGLRQGSRVRPNSDLLGSTVVKLRK